MFAKEFRDECWCFRRKAVTLVGDQRSDGCIEGRGTDLGSAFPGLCGAALMAVFKCIDGDLLPRVFDERVVGAGDMKDGPRREAVARPDGCGAGGGQRGEDI